MFSLRPSDIFRSSIFKLTLISSAAFLACALALILAVGMYYLNALKQENTFEIREAMEWLLEGIEEDGLVFLEEELEIDPEEVWEEDTGLYRLDEGEFVFALLNQDGSIEAGMPQLEGQHDRLHSELGFDDDEAWQELTFEWDEEKIETRLLYHPLEDERYLVLARSVSHEYFYLTDTLGSAIFWLFVTVISLALLTGYALSQQVFKRLHSLTQTIETIGHNNLQQRVELSEQDDEFNRLGAHINAMLDRIEALHKNLETVTVGIAHDLKTPLSRLSNRLQLLTQDLDQPNLREEHIEQANEQLEVILKTFHGLLRLSEIESGQRKKLFKEFNFSNLVQDLYDSYEPVFSDQLRQFDASIMPDIQLRGDEALLTQLISNLLENTIEHGQQKGKSWIRLQSHPDGAVLQIGDDGPGIPKEIGGRIFERFYRGDLSRNKPGNGLGLSLVKSICDLHEARIMVLEKQKGAVFDVYFKNTQ